MAVSMIGPKIYCWDRNGKPLAFGKLYTYQARTNSPKPTYQSEDQKVENTNPVILNGEGYANIYLSGSYKMVLKDEHENEIWSADPVSEASAGNGLSYILTAYYVTASSFKVLGDHTVAMAEGARVEIGFLNRAAKQSTVLSAGYDGQFTECLIEDAFIQTDITTAALPTGFGAIADFEEQGQAAIDQINEDGKNAIIGLGYIPPVVYEPGISFSELDSKKTIDRGGVVYAPNIADLPFTTSGTWVGDDDSRFFAIWNRDRLIFETTSSFILAGTVGASIPSGIVIETNGYYFTGDGGGAMWSSTGNVIAASQSPADLQDGLMSDPSGNEYKILPIMGCSKKEIGAKSLGCALDGVTDDTAAGQASFYAAEGGLLGWNGTMLTTIAMKAKSNTEIQPNIGSGIKASVTYTGAPTDIFEGALIRNENFTAASLTDENITVTNCTLDYTDRPSLGTALSGQQTGVFMRYVTNVHVDSCVQHRGGDMTAMLGCRDTFITNNVANDIANSSFDHWNSTGRAVVTGNISVCLTIGVLQGIQFTGDDTNPYTSGLLDTGATFDITIANNQVFSILKLENVGIIINNLRQPSATGRVAISNNIVSGSKYNYILQGDVSDVTINGGIATGATNHGVIILKHANETDPNKFPRNIVIEGVNFTDTADNNTIIDVRAGKNIKIRGGAMSGNYEYGAEFKSDSSDCTFDVDARAATISDVLDTGTDNLVIRPAMHIPNTEVFNGAVSTSFVDVDVSSVTGAIRSLCYLKINSSISSASRITTKTKGETIGVSVNSSSGPHICDVAGTESSYVTVMSNVDGVIQLYSTVAGNITVQLKSFVPLG